MWTSPAGNLMIPGQAKTISATSSTVMIVDLLALPNTASQTGSNNGSRQCPDANPTRLRDSSDIGSDLPSQLEKIHIRPDRWSQNSPKAPACRILAMVCLTKTVRLLLFWLMRQSGFSTKVHLLVKRQSDYMHWKRSALNSKGLWCFSGKILTVSLEAQIIINTYFQKLYLKSKYFIFY